MTLIDSISQIEAHPLGGQIVSGSHQQLETSTGVTHGKTSKDPNWCSFGSHHISGWECKTHPPKSEWKRHERKFLRIVEREGEPASWYQWPHIVDVGSKDLEQLYKTYLVRQRYSGKPLNPVVKSQGSPNKCLFCLDTLPKLSVRCSKCGGASHLACSREKGDICFTPGCDSGETLEKKEPK